MLLNVPFVQIIYTVESHELAETKALEAYQDVEVWLYSLTNFGKYLIFHLCLYVVFITSCKTTIFDTCACV